MRGRDSLEGAGIWRWREEGEQWLRNQFKGKGLEFHTEINTDRREVMLSVYRRMAALRMDKPAQKIFEVTEPIQSFVSHLTVTKIILIVG